MLVTDIALPDPSCCLGNARLAIVDDEADIREMVAAYLGRSGARVQECANGGELDAVLSNEPADLVLLDIAMPGEDGIAIARRLRAGSDVPIVMLTGLDSVLDRVVALEIGADDYIAKPVDLRELHARVRAVLRRGRSRPSQGREQPVQAAPEGDLVCFGDLCLDRVNRCLICRNGGRTELTATEYGLLDLFARNPNRVLSRERLMETSGSETVERVERCIDIRITRVRRKVERDPRKPAIIRTVRNAGYMFVPPRATA